MKREKTMIHGHLHNSLSDQKEKKFVFFSYPNENEKKVVVTHTFDLVSPP